MGELFEIVFVWRYREMATALEHCFIREQGAGRVQLLVGGRKQADGLFTIGVHDIVQQWGR